MWVRWQWRPMRWQVRTLCFTGPTMEQINVWQDRPLLRRWKMQEVHTFVSQELGRRGGGGGRRGRRAEVTSIHGFSRSKCEHLGLFALILGLLSSPYQDIVVILFLWIICLFSLRTFFYFVLFCFFNFSGQVRTLEGKSPISVIGQNEGSHNVKNWTIAREDQC